MQLRLTLIALVLLVAGCGGPGDSANQQSLDRSIASLVTHLEQFADIATLQALTQYTQRRYGVPELSSAYATYEGAARNPGERIFTRVVDPSFIATPNDLAQLHEFTDKMVAAALYCDVRPPPPAYRATLDTARRAGEYKLTHALLSLELLRENGCITEFSPNYMDSVCVEVAELSMPAGPPTDLAIEVEAFLSLVGRTDFLEPGFTSRLIKAQNPDGGFSPSGQRGEESSWHTGGLALWVLLAARYPDAPQVPFMSPR